MLVDIPLAKVVLISLLGIITPVLAESPLELRIERESDMYIQAITPHYHDDYFLIISEYDWDVKTAYKIMDCESGKNPNAHNFSHRTRDNSYGLFQINLYGNLANHRPSADWLLVPENNISYAYEVYKQQGWNGWRNCYRRI